MTDERDIPPHLRRSLEVWVNGFLIQGAPEDGTWQNTPLLESLEREMVLEPPFRWEDPHDDWSAHTDCMQRFEDDEGFAIRLIDKLLRIAADRHDALRLAAVLEAPGSRWEVAIAEYDHEQHHLEIAPGGPAKAAVQALGAGPAQEFIAEALRCATEIDGDPSKAYREAVRAVEAAAKPVVTPNDSLAHLGKIIGELTARPADWEVTLRADTVADLTRRAEILWRSQHDRHGSDVPTDPMTQPEALAAVHLAIELVAAFSHGLVRGAGS